ncbi:hypothetical protein DS2_08922 [Catenovulum agarivorans DS-2]|uniref:Uncharacterized protein n=2 Tax=Catenovulum agarivorans TaxID=1172192 RepID=W7QY29_9ALTE|nr:hypothetical protein DS2_08922 [Catenovulum agarivorans DS-2]
MLRNKHIYSTGIFLLTLLINFSLLASTASTQDINPEQASNPIFIGTWSGDVVTTKTTSTREYVEKNGVKQWQYNTESKDTHYPIIITLKRGRAAKLTGYIYHEIENCIYEINQQPFQRKRNRQRYINLAINPDKSSCDNKYIMPKFKLTLTSNDQISIHGRYQQRSANQDKSLIERKRHNSLKHQYAEALQQLQAKTNIVYKDIPIYQPAELVHASELIKIDLLFPHGFSKPNDIFISVSSDKYNCTNALYSQQSLNGKTVLTQHDQTCPIFKPGYFAVEPGASLKISWRPNNQQAKQTISSETTLKLKRSLPIKGHQQNIADYYFNQSRDLTLAQVGKAFSQAYSQRAKFLRQAFSEELMFDRYSYKFIGSWRGVIEINGGLEQTGLALWTGQSGDYNDMLGYLTIADACFYSVYLQNDNGRAWLNPKEHFQGRCEPTQIGIRARLRAAVYMNKSNTMLKFKFKNGRRTQDFVRAAFKREQPNDYMRSLFASPREKTYTPPNEATLNLMESVEVPGKSFEQNHKRALQQSKELLATRQAAGKREQERKQALALKQWQQKKQRQIEQGLRKPDNTNRYATASGDRQPMPTVTGPFDGLAGATFLNAVYKGDANLVRRINRSYALAFSQGLKTFFGSFSSQMTNNMADLSTAIKIQDSVAAKYLFEYQKHSASCLTDTAVTFYVTGYQPDMVFTNLLGVEIARHYGGTTVNKYNVNKEFTDVFSRVGKLKPEGIMANITSTLAHQKRKDLRKSALRGIEQMRTKFSCNSKEVKIFERNLIALYR